MASKEKELEDELRIVGNKPLNPPSSVNELLRLLQQVESCLLRVDQSPSTSMRNALSPLLKALVANELLRHSDIDVNVAVASCISEVLRITAPNAPYDDEKMKEIFQLIVAEFEKLSETSNHFYHKRVSILETVAKVRSCLVMLDLKCDTLIVEMFKHFLKAIRDFHPKSVFASMETIMSLVLEESYEISPEMLSPLLTSVKRENQDLLPITRKLAEKVLENCASKLKPYVKRTVEYMGLSLNDFSRTVSCIYTEKSDHVELHDANVSEEHKRCERKVESKRKRSTCKKLNKANPELFQKSVATRIKDPESRKKKKHNSNHKEETSKDEKARTSPTSQSSKKTLVVSDSGMVCGGESCFSYKAKESIANLCPEKARREKKKTSETSSVQEPDEKLVGSRIKVWWPHDKSFYEGVVDSFDPVKKKHKVLYVDGDVEILSLNKQQWEFVQGNSVPDQIPQTPHSVQEFDEKVIGSRIKVWWPLYNTFYEGVIDSYDPVRKKHKVLYVDGDVRKLNLSKERWEFVERNSVPDERSSGVRPFNVKPSPPTVPKTKGTKKHQSEIVVNGDFGAKVDAPSCSVHENSRVQSNLTELVEGFRVPKKFALLYRSIYWRHGGHIATTKVIKASMTAFEALVTDLLEVISSMTTKKISDINQTLLQYWDAKIFMVEALEFNVGWLRKRLNLLKDIYTTTNRLNATAEQSEGAFREAQQEVVVALEARDSMRLQLATADDRLAKVEAVLRARKADVESKAAEKAKFVAIMEQPLLDELY